MMKTLFTPTIIRLTIFSGLSIFAAFSVNEYALKSTDPPSDQRSLASVPNKKSVHTHNEYERSLPIRHTEKLLAPVVIMIKPTSNVASEPGDEFELEVMVKSRYNLSSLETEWIVPEGVELKSGSLKDTLYSMAADEVRSIHAVFHQVSDKNQQIHFRVKSLDSNLPFGASTQYNSIIQGDIDESVAALEERARKYMKDQNTKMVK